MMFDSVGRCSHTRWFRLCRYQGSLGSSRCSLLVASIRTIWLRPRWNHRALAFGTTLSILGGLRHRLPRGDAGLGLCAKPLGLGVLGIDTQRRFGRLEGLLETTRSQGRACLLELPLYVYQPLGGFVQRLRLAVTGIDLQGLAREQARVRIPRLIQRYPSLLDEIAYRGISVLHDRDLRWGLDRSSMAALTVRGLRLRRDRSSIPIPLGQTFDENTDRGCKVLDVLLERRSERVEPMRQAEEPFERT